MGACRSLNLLLGLSVAPDLGGPGAWALAAGYGLFVAGITWISRSEVETGRRGGIALGALVQAVGLAGILAGLAWMRSPDGRTSHSQWAGLLTWAAVGLVVFRADATALRKLDPRVTQRAVKVGVFSLVWIDVAMVAWTQGLMLSIAVALLWLPAYLTGRWIYST